MTGLEKEGRFGGREEVGKMKKRENIGDRGGVEREEWENREKQMEKNKFPKEMEGI